MMVVVAQTKMTAVEGGKKWLGFSKFYLEGGVNILP